jgi:hypothetical protein
VSAFTQLLKQASSANTGMPHALFCAGVEVAHDAPHADLDAAARAMDSKTRNSNANEDTRPIALTCLREVIAECESDTVTVRAAAALLSESLPLSTVAQERGIWIVRGRSPAPPSSHSCACARWSSPSVFCARALGISSPEHAHSRFVYIAH